MRGMKLVTALVIIRPAFQRNVLLLDMYMYIDRKFKWQRGQSRAQSHSLYVMRPAQETTFRLATVSISR